MTMVDEYMQGFVKKHMIKLAELTETQLAEVIIQAIKSGDFAVQVYQDQQVTYKPYRQRAALLATIEKLREELAELRDTLEPEDLQELEVAVAQEKTLYGSEFCICGLCKICKQSKSWE